MPAFSQAEDTGNAAIQYVAEQMMVGSRVELLGRNLASSHIIPELYSRREFKPAWTDARQVGEWIRYVGRAEEEGLNPDDYLYEELKELVELLASDGDNARLRGLLDVLLTESFSRYGNHLVYGKVNPAKLDKDWNWSQDLNGQDPVTLVQQAIDSRSIESWLANFLDRPVFYNRMKEMLAEYRALEAAGGWPVVPAGQTLKPGMQDDRISTIRARLAITGDLPRSEDNGSTNYDSALEAGVKTFQDRHSLSTDGAIGPETLAAMNVSAADRVDQIRINLERLRWVVRDLGDEFVVTNIASFETHLMRNLKSVWSTRSQVGKLYRQTPTFTAKIKYLQFNPTWTVPPGILANDILPAVKRDVGYLDTKDMQLIDRDGNIVDPATVDWSVYGGGRYPPFSFVQRPGPTNALGRVKFIFPNPHFVFLHDTPSKSLFERTDRAFSSGCIRVDRPFELAELLLDDPDAWNADSIQALLDTEKPQTVFLEEPLTVLLWYSTVAALDMEVVRFYKDVYSRDAGVLEALGERFQFRRAIEY